MRKKTPRIDTSPESRPLRGQPFAGLAELLPGNLQGQAAVMDSRFCGNDVAASCPPPQPVESKPTETGPVFRVERTRKGGYPIFLEKRPMGKTVTVIRNVSGDVEGLLRLLKKRCGAGGVAHAGEIELQGDHRSKLEAFLREKA